MSQQKYSQISSIIDPAPFDEHEFYEPPNPVDNAFDEKPDKVEPDYYCLAVGKWREGEFSGKYKRCYARAGSGTNHLGHGRCKHHGGNTARVQHRYAEMLNDTISEKLAKFLLDPNPLDLRAELAAARAIFEHTLETHEETQTALLAWHASFDKSRRGLHDKPLYHIDAIKHAFAILAEKKVAKPSLDQLQAALELGLEQARFDRRAGMTGAGLPCSEDLKVDRPTKMVDISHSVRVLKVVSELVKAIMTHERDAFLSVFAVNALIDSFTKQTRKVLTRHFRRLGVNDGETIQTILSDVSKEWQRAPVIETSVPRLAAERRQQDDYLGS